MSKPQNSRLRRIREDDVRTLETAIVTGLLVKIEMGQRPATVQYEHLMKILGGVSPPILWSIIKMSMRKAVMADRPILVAAAVGKSGKPGSEFYNCLRSCGIKTGRGDQAEESAWLEQFARVMSTPVDQL